MRWFLLVSCVGLSACNTTTATNEPEPQPVASEPAASVVKTRSMTFSAENNGSPIVANCTVQGPDFSRTFDTPTKLDIPIDSTSRAIISSISCEAGGMRAVASDIPGPQTKTVKARFGGSGLFGSKALLFGPGGNTVQYYVRSADEGVIRVGRAPDP